MRWKFWLSIGLLALALSACAALSSSKGGPALSFPPADAGGDVTEIPASPTATEGPTPATEASATPSTLLRTGPSPTAIPTTPPTLLPEEPPPGTGLGEAFLTWDGTRYQPHPSEGGQPRRLCAHNSFQVKLLHYLQDRFDRGRFERVSYERGCSGRGLPSIRSRRAPTSRTAAMLTNRPG